MASIENSPADILATYLIGVGVVRGATTGHDWSCYVSFLPDDDPDNAVSVIDTTPKTDGRSAFDGEVWEHPGCQITIRSINYQDGRKRAAKIVAKLDALLKASVTVESTTYTIHSVTRTGGINSIGKEQNRDPERNLFTINLLMSVR